MKIIFHILAKDLRRHWREIGLYVLACAAWGWQTVHPLGWEWLRQREFVPILLFGLWFFVTVRVVQGESLVGDREFWMTRPYRWGYLMAAKAIALVLCLNLPLLITEIVLLASAGIPFSWHLVPGLLFLQILFAFFITFPAAALASITESLVQWGLAIAGMFVLTLMVTWLPWDKLPPALSGGENVGSSLGMALIAPALAFVLVWQYARRRVWPARLAFAAALLVVPLVVFFASTPLIRAIAYPDAKGKTPLQLSMAEDSKNGGRTYSRYRNAGNEVNISLPVAASLNDSDTMLDVDGLRVTLTGDNGWRWQSSWLNNSVRFSKDSPGGSLWFTMPVKLADQIVQVHAKATAELAFSVYRFGPPHLIEAGANSFNLTSEIACHWYGSEPDTILIFDGFECVAPLHLPERMEVRMDSSTNTCKHEAESESPLPAGHYATDSESGTNMPADFDPDPVHKLNLNFGVWIPTIPSAHDPKTNLQAAACRGTPFTVRLGALDGSMRATFNLGSVGVEKKIVDDEEQSVPFSPRAH